MKFIRPNTINDSVLISSNVPEADHPAWSATTAYSLGAKVIRPSTHRIYERKVAGTTATAPESDTVNWMDIGPTNRWGMFDSKIGTVTTKADSITVSLAPGRINSLALLNCDASTVTVTLTVGVDTVYTASLDLDSGNTVGNWYEYFYEPIYQQGEVIITDLLDAGLLDVPGYGEGVLTVTLARPGGTVSCGLMVVGIAFDVGLTQYGASVSIRDFSRKEADTFGNWAVVERGYSKKMTATVEVDASKVDNVTRNVTRYRATPLVWIGSTLYGALVVYGFVTDWSLTVSTVSISEFNLEVEGLT